jgi:hypothetical protein
MKVVKEHMNEAIKHLKPRSSEELLNNFLDTGEIENAKMVINVSYIWDTYDEVNIFIINRLKNAGIDIDKNYKIIQEKMLKTFEDALQHSIEMY